MFIETCVCEVRSPPHHGTSAVGHTGKTNGRENKTLIPT